MGLFKNAAQFVIRLIQVVVFSWISQLIGMVVHFIAALGTDHLATQHGIFLLIVLLRIVGILRQ
jgi:hypothetical protein